VEPSSRSGSAGPSASTWTWLTGRLTKKVMNWFKWSIFAFSENYLYPFCVYAKRLFTLRQKTRQVREKYFLDVFISWRISFFLQLLCSNSSASSWSNFGSWSLPIRQTKPGPRTARFSTKSRGNWRGLSCDSGGRVICSNYLWGWGKKVPCFSVLLRKNRSAKQKGKMGEHWCSVTTLPETHFSRFLLNLWSWF